MSLSSSHGRHGRARLATFGSVTAWMGGAGTPGLVSAPHGAVRQARQGSARFGAVRPGKSRLGLVRQAGHDQSWCGPARVGIARQGLACPGSAGWAWHGALVPAVARLGAAWQACRGGAGRGLAWPGMARLGRLGMFRFGWARPGQARLA